ncbi:hypothetical protein IP954_12510 [Leptospira borgpetersenii serovar Tarassovi]|nr:hypothetical protein [Leptospira borgpetersenii serovar Tarassovi]
MNRNIIIAFAFVTPNSRYYKVEPDTEFMIRVDKTWENMYTKSSFSSRNKLKSIFIKTETLDKMAPLLGLKNVG